MNPFPRPHRFDVVIAAVGLAGGLLMWALGLFSGGSGLLRWGWTLVPLTAMAALELLRRTRPRIALLGGTAAVVADQFTSGNLATVLMFTDVVYAAVLYGTPAAARRIPVTTGLITVTTTIGYLAWFRTPQALLLGIVTGLVCFAPATTGALVRNHRDAAEAATLRAEQTALLAEMDRAQAVVAERARMARELHDMVANHLSAIAIHSTAALSLDEPATTRRALTVIRENSVDGLAEMRRLIGLLRDSGAATEPAAAPTLAGLDALVAQARTNGASSGLDFTLRDERPAGAALPAPVELAAYRIVQESLTNALKHASPGTVTAALAHTGRALTVEVSSPYGDGERPGPRAPGSGAGLVGMRERAVLLGGTFASGPEPSEQGREIWWVRAELPVQEGESQR
ncbi:two-component sensor histidine kinase [Streptomyces sp. ERV7]|uniref:sensor histidine kinase n=1 Tax=Streptomyces sp. ERV7 TaxID=1322334 RepID=UPI0007F39524|nr:histidine kinase [Streptomyces sp. ERV7]OAR22228.1 two-component sensor histidine kinase [Streptomyces sp. ERV7]OAR24813.1 two-component sensor histidine kinase [Streptomyces sp. ERV7]OAR24815.1 two-component sensor histidine kinase [Streptomyces sp. ERV7]